MINRSVPVDNVLPHIVYQNVARAIEWLKTAFGFVEHYRYGPNNGEVGGAQMHLGNAWIMLTSARTGSSPAQAGTWTQSLTVFVDNVEAHMQRSKSAGAKIVEKLHETVYGEQQYGAEDLEGHHWLFAKHVRDVNPTEWGATVKEGEKRPEVLPLPCLCYLEIPAIMVRPSAAFYEKVFGWRIRQRDTDHPKFDAGNISGTWMSGRDISRTPGLLPYIWVESIDATLEQITAEGGRIVEMPHLDAPDGEWIATFRDPAGNLIGLYQEGPR